jgi:hypothetical protein
MRKRLARLHSDEGGQVLWFFVLTIAALVMLVAFVFNTGKQVTRKIEMQNAVDTAAISGATWVARGLNVMSMNNVAMTQTFALIVNLRAMVMAAKVNKTILTVEDIAASALMSNPFTFVAGFILKVAVIVGRIPTEIVLKLEGTINQLAEPTSGYLWTFMKGLSAFSKAMKVAVPPIALLQAHNIGRNNVSHPEDGEKILAVFLPSLSNEGPAKFPGFEPYLPVEEGQFRELCDPTQRGTPKAIEKGPLDKKGVGRRGYTPLLGYEPDEGPFEVYKGRFRLIWWPSIITAIPAWWGPVADLNLSMFCSDSFGKISLPLYEAHIPVLQAAHVANAETFVWQSSKVKSKLVTLARSKTLDFTRGGISPEDAKKEAEDLAKANPNLSEEELRRLAQQKADQLQPSVPTFRDPCIDVGSYYASEHRESPESEREFERYLKDFKQVVTPTAQWQIWSRVSNPAKVTYPGPNTGLTCEVPPPLPNAPPDAPPPDVYEVKEERETFQYGIVKKSLDADIKDLLGAAGLGKGDDYPIPYHFTLGKQKGEMTDPKDLPKAVELLQYLTVAYRGSTGTPAMENAAITVNGETKQVFHNPNQFGIVTYAQAQVYNPTSWDLYTQNWHAKLVPATELEKSIGNFPGFIEKALSYLKPIEKALNEH